MDCTQQHDRNGPVSRDKSAISSDLHDRSQHRCRRRRLGRHDPPSVGPRREGLSGDPLAISFVTSARSARPLCARSRRLQASTPRSLPGPKRACEPHDGPRCGPGDGARYQQSLWLYQSTGRGYVTTSRFGSSRPSSATSLEMACFARSAGVPTSSQRDRPCPYRSSASEVVAARRTARSGARSASFARRREGQRAAVGDWLAVDAFGAPGRATPDPPIHPRDSRGRPGRAGDVSAAYPGRSSDAVAALVRGEATFATERSSGSTSRGTASRLLLGPPRADRRREMRRGGDARVGAWPAIRWDA